MEKFFQDKCATGLGIRREQIVPLALYIPAIRRTGNAVAACL